MINDHENKPPLNYPVPENEEARLEALYRLEMLDTPPETVFDDLTLIASHICETPIALITLLDKNRQWFKSKIGVEIDELERSVAVCSYTIMEPTEMFIVEDTQKDPRFMNNPLVRGYPKIRFYAGVPLVDPEGFSFGTMCVMDYKPRTLDNAGMTALYALSRSVMSEIKLRKKTERLEQLYERTMALAEIELAINQHDELKNLLDSIVDVTTRLLPSTGGASIILWDEEKGRFIVSASTVPAQPSHTAASRVRRKGGATRWIIENQKPLIVNDIRNDPFTANPLLNDFGLRAYVGVPLIAGTKAIGVLYGLDQHVRDYDQMDLEFLTTLAARATLAIEKVKKFEEIRTLSIIDELTGIYNRRHYFELSAREYEQANRYEYPLSVIILDIDHFKKINDTYGHTFGDRVLERFSSICTKHIRKSDIFGRYGGEEFSITLPSTDMQGAVQFAERLRKEVESALFHIEELEISLTASFGIASLTNETKNIKSLVDQADGALYKAKQEGRNCVRWVLAE